METSKQTGHKRGASESLNRGDPPSETEQRATRSATRSRRNSAELHASGTVQERRGRDVAEHHAYFDLWAGSSLASSPAEGWSSKQIWGFVQEYPGPEHNNSRRQGWSEQ